MGIGGSIESVSISGRIFAAAADADSNRKLGGFENEVQPNGDGTSRVIKTRATWKVDGLTLSIDDDRGDHEFLQDLADSAKHHVVSITYASGAVYQGQGTIVGEMQVSNQSTTAAVTLAGGGKLTKQ
ncbi:MAG: hypothetical protein GY767_22665 [Shimia sp.]|nr:hypothetical protein [Shimia sp.]